MRQMEENQKKLDAKKRIMKSNMIIFNIYCREIILAE